MKQLELNQMEQLEGGNAACTVFAIGSVALGIVAMATPVGALAWGLSSAFGLSFGVAGIGCAFME